MARESIRITPMAAPVGADVTGVDLARPVDAATVEAVRQALGQYAVLRFRDQHLSDEALSGFTRHFGELDFNPAYAVPSLGVGPDDAKVPDTVKYVAIVSNVIENGKPIGGLGFGEAVWHSDMTYIDAPPAACLLYALEVPTFGGDTGFLSLYHAYETLDPALQQRVQGLQLKHDATYNSGGELRRGMVEHADPRRTTGTVHPLVTTHPRSGRKLLLLGRRRNAYIAGLELDESEALLDALWAHATRAEHAWYQQWKAGDVVFWDNLATMHRRDAFPAHQRRIMHRTQVLGSPLQ